MSNQAVFTTNLITFELYLEPNSILIGAYSERGLEKHGAHSQQKKFTKNSDSNFITHLLQTNHFSLNGEQNRMPIEQIRIKDKQELEKIVMEEMNAIESGLTVIYNNIKIDPKTSLDILCHDTDGRLVVMQLNTTEDDNMFFEGLRCLNYIDTVKPMLKAAYEKAKINESATPRLILLAPNFSPNLRNVVENTNVIEVDLYEWDYLQIGDKKGLYAHPIFINQPRPKQTEEEKDKTKQTKKTEKKTKQKPEPPTPEKKKEEPEPFPPKPPAVVMPPKEIAQPAEQKKQEKEKKKSIFSL